MKAILVAHRGRNPHTFKSKTNNKIVESYVTASFTTLIASNPRSTPTQQIINYKETKKIKEQPKIKVSYKSNSKSTIYKYIYFSHTN